MRSLLSSQGMWENSRADIAERQGAGGVWERRWSEAGDDEEEEEEERCVA